MELKDRAQSHIQRMDLIVHASEVKWGLMFRLKQLVPDDLAAKFQRKWDELSEAVMDKRYEDTIILSDDIIRGVGVLEAAAVDAGHVPEDLLPIGVETPRVVHESVPSGVETLPKSFWRDGGDDLPF